MGTTATTRQPDRDLVLRIATDFILTPELVVTAAQAGRLWHAPGATCRGVLDALVSDGFLEQRPDRAYVRRTAWARPGAPLARGRADAEEARPSC